MEAAGNQEGPAHAATAKEVAARLHEIGKHEPAADMLLAVGDAEVSLATKVLCLGMSGMSISLLISPPLC